MRVQRSLTSTNRPAGSTIFSQSTFAQSTIRTDLDGPVPVAAFDFQQACASIVQAGGCIGSRTPRMCRGRVLPVWDAWPHPLEPAEIEPQIPSISVCDIQLPIRWLFRSSKGMLPNAQPAAVFEGSAYWMTTLTMRVYRFPNRNKRTDKAARYAVIRILPRFGSLFRQPNHRSL